VPFNGAGMFVRLRNWVEDATAGVKIRADYHDIEDDNFAGGISQCIARDGQSTVLNNIPMNSKRMVSLSDPVDPQDASTKAYADTKLPLAGGTITGDLTVTGKVSTTGYRTRTGLSGTYGGSYFNFNWSGSYLQVWVDTTNIGDLATTAYVENRAQAWANQAAAPKVNRVGDTMSGVLNTAASGNLGAGGSLNSITIWGGTNDWAAMSFHSPGAFGGNFGMHPNGDFYCGGWSFGTGVAYKFWTTRNLNPIQDGRLVNAGDFTAPRAGNSVTAGVFEPRTGAVVTGLNFVGGDAGATGSLAITCQGGRWRFMQLLTPGGWYTVAYA
jgi:hypothetical protein